MMMDHQLQEDTKKFQDLTQGTSVLHVVLGNEACDLDSAASAFVYSRFLEASKRDEPSVPVLNINSSDFALKTEVVYLFEKLEISKDRLVFRDQLDLHELSRTREMKVTLVDQNVLRGDDTYLEKFVVEVIDHHRKERAPELKCEMTLEMVGSCATLVAEKILMTQPEFLDKKLGQLLYGAILIDTANLSPVAKRATAKDYEIAAKLAELLPEVDAKAFFEELQAAKEDISKLSSVDLLRKDVKTISGQNLRVALSSLPILAMDYGSRTDGLSSVESYFRSQSLSAQLLLGTKINRETGVIQRDLCIYSPDKGFARKISKSLTENEEPPLYLDPVATSDHESPFKMFRQGNSTVSRKIILPLVKSFLDSQSPDNQSGTVHPAEGPTGSSSVDEQSQPPTPSSVAERRSREESPFILTPPVVHVPNGLHPQLVTSALHLLTVGTFGESLQGSNSQSQGSSSYNSGPYTPQNSCGEEVGSVASGASLPSFNSRDMLEKIESKRGQLLGCDFEESHNYPFTPKNSFADSSFEAAYQRLSQTSAIDSDTIVRKLSEKSGQRSPVLEEVESESDE